MKCRVNNWSRLLVVMLFLLLMPISSAVAERLVDTMGAIAPGQMPCIGNPKVVVFCVTFPGGKLSAGNNHITLTTEEVENWFFSPALKHTKDSSKAYTEEDSVRSYYYRSSYGKVDITGTVYEYTAQHDASYYTADSLIWGEIFSYYENLINWSEYDTNGDGYLDGAYILARTLPAWTDTDVNNFVGDYQCTVGGIKTNRVCYIRSQDFRTFCHETYHMFGLGDMYAGVGLNPAGINTECIMGGGPNGGGLGDIPGISKYIMGWIDNAHFVTGLGSRTIELSSYSMEGELIVVHPNGDKTNSNWFVVEYVTNQANNLHNGIRIWRTNMCNLDAEHNIAGAKEITIGRPVSPMEYIEAISPGDVYNYYYQPGEAVTPTSSPSSAYGAIYTQIGDHKYITQSAYSGISIRVDSISNGVARLTITIEDNPESVAGTAKFQLIDPAEESVYIDLVEGFHFGTVEADYEMNLNGEIFILDAESGEKIPVSCVLDSKGQQARLWIPQENLASISLDHPYYLQTAGALTFYTGSELEFADFDGCFEFVNVKSPLIADYRRYNLEFNDCGVLPFLMKLDAEHVCYVDFDGATDELSLNIINVKNNSAQKRVLEAGLATSDTQPYVESWQIDADCFGVLIKLTDSSSYLAYYSFAGAKIAGLLLEDDAYRYIGSASGVFLMNNDTNYVEGKTRIFEIVLENNTLKRIPLDFFCDWIGDGKPYYIVYINKMDDDTYTINYSGRAQDDSTYNKVQIVSRKNGMVPLRTGRSSCWIYGNKKAYHFMITADSQNATADCHLELDIYNEAGVVERSVTLLTSFPIDYHAAIMKDGSVFYEKGLWIITFRGFSRWYEQSYFTDYLFVFDENFQLLGYYHGDQTSSDNFSALYVGDMTFLLAGLNEYRYVSLGHCDETEGHIPMKTQGIPATCKEPGLSEGMICAKCGIVLVEVKKIPAVGKIHVWDKGIEVEKPTCLDHGCWAYTCTVCGEASKRSFTEPNGHQGTLEYIKEGSICSGGCAVYFCNVCKVRFEEQFLPQGHTEVVDAAIAATCTTPGLTEGKHCSVCGMVTVEQTIVPTTDHTEVVDAAIAATCTTTGLTEGKHCSVCGMVIVEQIVSPANGHFWLPLTSVLPSETTNGIKTEVCYTCKEYRREVIPHLGCTTLPGDADCNGTVDVYDALLILQSIAGWEVKVCSVNADADADGTVTIDEALRVLELCFAGDMTKAARVLQAMMRSMSISQLQIVEQPSDQYVMVGQRAKFTVSATGDGLTYQWYINRNDGMGWQALENAAKAVYVTSAVTNANAGYQYRCVIMDVYGSELTSEAATLNVEYELPATDDLAEPVLWFVLVILSSIGMVVLGKRKVSM